MREPSAKAAIRRLWLGGAICAMAVTGLAAGAAAQSGQDEQNPPSLGEIARRLRAQRPVTQEAKMVWTNDNIPKNPFGISVVGPPPPPPAEDASAKPAVPASPAPAKPKPATDLEADLAAAQAKLETLEKELDLDKRDYLLQQQGYYTNPMATQDPQIQASLAAGRDAIDAKQTEVDKAKAEVADLQVKLDEAKKNPPPKQPDNPSQN
ncbi:MAG TPA: hypothetical protein VGZ48_09910 [Candidatus Acidoferrales bacterium]|jgi:hypothetical protein|nr:hypothetical protein [Candidatus Acidoferrales bacterium]